MIQLLQLYMLLTGMHQGVAEPRFEPLALGRPLTWKYRGQVISGNRLVTITIEITEKGRDEQWSLRRRRSLPMGRRQTYLPGNQPRHAHCRSLLG
jgi:hypothetical protein